MCIGEKENDTCVEDKKLRNCDTFIKYVGSIIIHNGKVEKDINNRIRMG